MKNINLKNKEYFFFKYKNGFWQNYFNKRNKRIFKINNIFKKYVINFKYSFKHKKKNKRKKRYNYVYNNIKIIKNFQKVSHSKILKYLAYGRKFFFSFSLKVLNNLLYKKNLKNLNNYANKNTFSDSITEYSRNFILFYKKFNNKFFEFLNYRYSFFFYRRSCMLKKLLVFNKNFNKFFFNFKFYKFFFNKGFILDLISNDFTEGNFFLIFFDAYKFYKKSVIEKIKKKNFKKKKKKSNN